MMDGNISAKYIVRRIDTNEVVEDAVVFRLQDRFSSVAIQAYADAVDNAIAILEYLDKVELKWKPKTFDQEIEQLENIRFWAFHAAEFSRSHGNKKLPDA